MIFNYKFLPRHNVLDQQQKISFSSPHHNDIISTFIPYNDIKSFTNNDWLEYFLDILPFNTYFRVKLDLTLNNGHVFESYDELYTHFILTDDINTDALYCSGLDIYTKMFIDSYIPKDSSKEYEIDKITLHFIPNEPEKDIHTSLSILAIMKNYDILKPVLTRMCKGMKNLHVDIDNLTLINPHSNLKNFRFENIVDINGQFYYNIFRGECFVLIVSKNNFKQYLNFLGQTFFFKGMDNFKNEKSNITLSKNSGSNRISLRSLQNSKNRFISSYNNTNLPFRQKSNFHTQSNSQNIKIFINYLDFVNNPIDSLQSSIYARLKPFIKYSFLATVEMTKSYVTLSERQHFFLFQNNEVDIKQFEALSQYINIHLDRVLDEYQYYGDCIVISLNFIPLNSNYDIITNNLYFNSLSPNISRYKISRLKRDYNLFDNNILKLYSTPLTVYYNQDNKPYFNDQYDILKNFSFNNVKHRLSDFYLINYRKDFYVIGLYKVDNSIVKQAFNTFGMSLQTVSEISKDDNSIIRISGNIITEFNNKDIVNIAKNIKFKPIELGFKKQARLNVNENIGTIDLETYNTNEGGNNISKCYAIGFYIENLVKTYYVDSSTDSNHKIIQMCINELLKTKYSSYTFYCHNLGRFDAPFIIKALLEFNKDSDIDSDPFIFDIFTRDSAIIRLTIKRKINGKVRVLNIYDSLPILSLSLRELCISYKIEQPKTFFPYTFVNENTFEYIGNTPDKYYYGVDSMNDDEKLQFEEFYTKNYSNLWNLKEETIKYLEIDLTSLYNILKLANLNMFTLFGAQMTENSTISGIAMRIFLNRYYNHKELPLIRSKSIYKDLYKSYYGGRVEVFNPKPIENEKLYYYDVNSLYPFAALNDMPGLNWVYHEYMKDTNLDNLFGFYYCRVITNNNTLGLLPYRTENKGLLFPNGKWYGWYFSEELKLAKENGYDIQILKGYSCDRAKDIFVDFVHSVAEVKNNPEHFAQRNVAKLILNSLIGRFGMNPDKVITRILNSNEHNIILLTRVVKSSIELDNNNYLTTFIPEINRDVCISAGLNYVDVLNDPKFNIDKGKPLINNTVSISTASAILSYSRIFMNKVMLSILDKGGRLYYTDTDSIVTNIKLDDNLIHPKELGKFKLENEITEAYFITDKTYLIRNTEGKIIKKAKGVKEGSLTLDDYKRLYNLEVFDKAIKVTSRKDYIGGYVSINPKIVTLNVDNYNKRNRVIVDGNWVTTKPKYINDVDKSLILYENIKRDKKSLNIYIPPPLQYINNEDFKDITNYTTEKSLPQNSSNKPWTFKWLFFKLDCYIFTNYLTYTGFFLTNIMKLYFIFCLVIPIYFLLIVLFNFYLDISNYNLDITNLEEYYENTEEVKVDKPTKDTDSIINMLYFWNLNHYPSQLQPYTFYGWDFNEVNYNPNDYRGFLVSKIEAYKFAYLTHTSLNSSICLRALEAEFYNKYGIEVVSKVVDKYLGIEDVRYLFESEEPKNKGVKISIDTNISRVVDNYTGKYTPFTGKITPFTGKFTPFTPDTLFHLKFELENTDIALEKIYNNFDSKSLTEEQRTQVKDLLEDKQYYLNQEKKHILSVESKLKKDSTITWSYILELETLISKLEKTKNDAHIFIERIENDINNMEKNDKYKSPLSTSSSESEGKGEWRKLLTNDEQNHISSIQEPKLRQSVKDLILKDKKL